MVDAKIMNNEHATAAGYSPLTPEEIVEEQRRRGFMGAESQAFADMVIIWRLLSDTL